jgi:hypothetical protein
MHCVAAHSEHVIAIVKYSCDIGLLQVSGTPRTHRTASAGGVPLTGSLGLVNLLDSLRLGDTNWQITKQGYYAFL